MVYGSTETSSAQLEADRSEDLEKAEIEAGENATVAEIYGQVAWLMMLSAQHKHFFLADMEWRVVPAIMLRQFKLYKRRNVPVGFVSWAFVSPEVKERLETDLRLRPGDWRSGEEKIIVDIVAPFGGGDKISSSAQEQGDV